MIAIGSPLTNALGIAGSVGSHAVSQFPVPESRAPGARSQFAAGSPVGSRGGRGGRLAARGCRPVAGRVELGLRGGAFGRQLVQLGLLRLERLLRLRQRRHRGLLAGFRVGDRLVGVLLGQPRGRFLVHLLGAGALKIGDHLLRAHRQGLTGGRGGQDVGRVAGGQVGIRRAVDIRCGGEGVEPLLRRGDRGVGVGDPLRAGIHFLLRGGGVVPRRLHVDDRLVDAFLLRLDGGAEVLRASGWRWRRRRRARRWCPDWPAARRPARASRAARR